jgi:pyrroline-5-carboxylate reductase
MKRTQKRQKIVIIGCGNLAWHLALHLSSLNKFDLHVYNHHPNKQLNSFKRKLNCKVYESISDIINDAQYYLICVSDKYIKSVSVLIKPASTDSLVLHTSGSKSISELKNNKAFKGVFYPLQTFSKQSKVNWKNIPVLIEVNNASNSA